jgi:hypothetical protein
MHEEKAHVGLVISGTPPHVVMEVQDVVYATGSPTEHAIVPGDILTAVEEHPVVHATAKRLHALFEGELFSHVRLSLCRGALEYSVTLVRHSQVEQTKRSGRDGDASEDAAPAGPRSAEGFHALSVEKARAHAFELMLCGRETAVQLGNSLPDRPAAFVSASAHLAWHEPAYVSRNFNGDEGGQTAQAGPLHGCQAHKCCERECFARRIANEIALMRGTGASP